MLWIWVLMGQMGVNVCFVVEVTRDSASWRDLQR